MIRHPMYRTSQQQQQMGVRSPVSMPGPASFFKGMSLFSPGKKQKQQQAKPIDNKKKSRPKINSGRPQTAHVARTPASHGGRPLPHKGGSARPSRPAGWAPPPAPVPEDYPAWYLVWKSQQRMVQPCRTVMEVARLAPAEFVSKRPLLGYQEATADGKKTYIKVSTRDWDVLRGGKVYKGAVNIQTSEGQAGFSDKVRYLRCLDQKRRSMFIPLTARGEFFVASSKILDISSPSASSPQGQLQPGSNVKGFQTSDTMMMAPGNREANNNKRRQAKAEGIDDFVTYMMWKNKQHLLEQGRELKQRGSRSEVEPPKRINSSAVWRRPNAAGQQNQQSQQNKQAARSKGTLMSTESGYGTSKSKDEDKSLTSKQSEDRKQEYKGVKSPQRQEDPKANMQPIPEERPGDKVKKPVQSNWQFGTPMGGFNGLKSGLNGNRNISTPGFSSMHSENVLNWDKPQTNDTSHDNNNNVPDSPEPLRLSHNNDVISNTGSDDVVDPAGVSQRENFWSSFFTEPPESHSVSTHL